HLVVIEVAAERPQIAGVKCLLPKRRNSNAAKERLQRHGKSLQLLRRMLEPGDSFLSVQMPGAVEILHLFRLVPRLDRVGSDTASGPGHVTVEPNLIEMNYQGVAAKRPFDIEGSGERIAAARSRDSILVHASGIDGLGAHRVAGPNPQHRRNCA